MRKIVLLIIIVVCTTHSFAQSNTAPLPDGNTKIGGHLWAGASNEVWTETGSNVLYFNYRGTASNTLFWNLKGPEGHPILTINSSDRVDVNGDLSLSGNANLSLEKLYGCILSDSFTFDNKTMPHYGYKWYIYSKATGGGTFALSGYSGIQMFTGGKMNFYMSCGGNVGIGTENPTNKLDVNGTIRAKEVKVESGWADFVFKPDYQLKPLSEVEQFISTNGHLPEIPTAKEVEKNGVNLGDMNAKLLQKVEELTLYLIEKDKKIEDMQKQINEIKQQIRK